MPSAATVQSSAGKPPAGFAISRQIDWGLSVGSTAISHSAIRMLVADVDHGNEIATPKAIQSARFKNRLRSNVMARLVELILWPRFGHKAIAHCVQPFSFLLHRSRIC